MSTHNPESGAAAPDAPVRRAEASLPLLSAERIDEIEDALFAGIARERARQSTSRTRRGRLWIAGGAAAAVIAVAAIIAPSVGSLVTGDQYAVAPVAPADSAGGSTGDEGLVATDGREADSGPAAEDSAGGAATTVAPDRDIITTASATVTVDDVEDAARAVGETAVDHGGYVESMNIGTSGSVTPVDPMEGGVVDSTMPYPYPPTDGAWVTVRVPADELSAVVAELDALGEVTASDISRQDVTEQTVDLQARIDAAQASVDRLTELMSQAQSVGDLIAAEAALSERQATLESYQQQLEMLDDQVAMSTLSVTLLPRVVPVEADPAGFADGVAAGWNGLIATLNGIVVAIGFLLPWLAVAAVIALIAWGVIRLLRTRRRRRRDAAAQPSTPHDRP